MTENVHWVPFEELAHATGHGGGTSFSSMLLTFGDMFERIDGEYVVYWPKDGIRATQETVSFDAALFIAAILNDPNTLWFGDPAAGLGTPEISLPRRDLSFTKFARPADIGKRWPHVKDAALLGEVKFSTPGRKRFEQGDGEARNARLDMSSVPR